MHFRGASTSTYVDRVLGEQAAIESRLVELVGVEVISSGLKDATIKSEEHMKVDVPPEPPVSRAIAAKQRALSRFVCFGSKPLDTLLMLSQALSNGTGRGALNLQEAINLEREAHLREKDRVERITERKRRLGMPIKGEVLSRQEREARIWAFM